MQISSLLSRIVSTSDSFAPAIIRVTLGLVMLPHGLQKTLGWFGGYGFNGTMGWLTGTVGAPWIFALLAVLAESVGSLMLIAGLGTRVAAIGIGGVMTVATTIHWANGFFMNWTGSQKGEGFEYHLLALGMVLALVIAGGGKWSMDRLIRR